MAKNQTSKNSNLFYQLYSTPQKVTDSGFVCNTAVDESDTSFDISGSEGTITDGNGDELASIDLSEIHADELSEYYTETKIIGPQSAYLLQGNVTGECYAMQAFIMKDEIAAVEYYNSFINIRFHINWASCGDIDSAEIDTYVVRTEPGDVIELIQNELDKLCIPVAVTIQNLESCSDCSCKKCADMRDYLVFQSNEEGYQFFVHSVYVSAIDVDYENFNGEWADYSESPFVGANIDFDYILNLIRKYAPRLAGNCDCCSQDYTDVPCDIYKFLVSIAPLAMNDKDAFAYNMKGLREFAKYIDQNGNVIDDVAFRKTAAKYPDLYSYYFGLEDAICEKYNIHDILKMLAEISTYIHECNIQGPYLLQEEFCKRVGPQKYPNGAMRGVIIIPDWSGDHSDYEPIRVAHVPDTIPVYEEVELPKGFTMLGHKGVPTLYHKYDSTVKVNALIQSEFEIYKKNCCQMPLRKVVSNDSLTQTTDSIWTHMQHKPMEGNTEWCNSWGYHTEADKWCANKEYHNFATPEEVVKNEKYDPFVIREDFINEMVTPAIYPTAPKFDKYGNIPGRTKDDIEIYGRIEEEKVSGLYRLMSFLNENNMMIPVGEIYMVIAGKEDYTTNVKNLLNSCIIYNPNNVPIRCKIMVMS